MFPLLDVFIGATRVILEVPKREVNGLKSYPTFSPWHSLFVLGTREKNLETISSHSCFFLFFVFEGSLSAYSKMFS